MYNVLIIDGTNCVIINILHILHVFFKISEQTIGVPLFRKMIIVIDYLLLVYFSIVVNEVYMIFSLTHM